MRLPLTIVNGAMRQLPSGEQLATNPAYCKLGAATSSVANNSTVQVNLNAQISNTAFFNSPTDRLKIPVNGVYLISVFSQFQSNNSGRRDLFIGLNGAGIRLLRNTAPGVGQNWTEIMMLNQNDYFSFRLFQDSGVTLSISNFSASIIRVN